MKTEDLRNLIEKVCKIDDDEEIMLMLDFYHDLGQIVKHGNTVVLQTQWLINLFKQVITIPRREKQVRIPNHPLRANFPETKTARYNLPQSRHLHGPFQECIL